MMKRTPAVAAAATAILALGVTWPTAANADTTAATSVVVRLIGGVIFPAAGASAPVIVKGDHLGRLYLLLAGIALLGLLGTVLEIRRQRRRPRTPAREPALARAHAHR